MIIYHTWITFLLLSQVENAQEAQCTHPTRFAPYLIHVENAQEARGARGRSVRGTLGSLEVKDTSCPNNINPYFLSATKNAGGESLVTFEIVAPDPTAMLSYGAGPSLAC